MIKKSFKYDAVFHLEGGGTLDQLDICYHVSSESFVGKRIIWICHALTANSDPSEWWDTLCGPGKYFDTERDFIVCANILGSCYGTKCNWIAEEPPVISIRDMVQAHIMLSEHIGIDHIDLLIGGSSGGFQAVEWAIGEPQFIRNVCLIATNAVISPWGTALNEAQRMALLAGNLGASGLAAARAIALISYRSYDGYCATQQEADSDFFIASRAVSYQNYQGKKLVDRFDPFSYYLLTLGLDTHNVGRWRGGIKAALRQITAKVLCIAIDSDMLFPVSELQFIADTITEQRGKDAATLEIIYSRFGHDGFLLESGQISAALDKFLNPTQNASS